MLPARFMTMEKCTMKRSFKNIWVEQDGVLSFEWTMLLTLVVIGIVSGLAGARDAVIDELGDVAEAAQGIDQSYSLAGLSIDFNGDAVIDFTTNASVYTEGPEDFVYTDCTRAAAPLGQSPQQVLDSDS
jgi:Flp pilus assembly pilin Flp